MQAEISTSPEVVHEISAVAGFGSGLCQRRKAPAPCRSHINAPRCERIGIIGSKQTARAFIAENAGGNYLFMALCPANYFAARFSLIAACVERYSGRTFWTTAPYPSNCMAYDPSDNFPPFMSLTIEFDEAEAYRKSIGCYLRRKQWEDITVDVYL